MSVQADANLAGGLTIGACDGGCARQAVPFSVQPPGMLTPPRSPWDPPYIGPPLPGPTPTPSPAPAPPPATCIVWGDGTSMCWSCSDGTGGCMSLAFPQTPADPISGPPAQVGPPPEPLPAPLPEPAPQPAPVPLFWKPAQPPDPQPCDCLICTCVMNPGCGGGGCGGGDTTCQVTYTCLPDTCPPPTGMKPADVPGSGFSQTVKLTALNQFAPSLLITCRETGMTIGGTCGGVVFHFKTTGTVHYDVAAGTIFLCTQGNSYTSAGASNVPETVQSFPTTAVISV